LVVTYTSCRKQWQEPSESAKLIRQISAIFDSRSLGCESSLVAARVEPARVDDAAVLSRHPGVSYNELLMIRAGDYRDGWKGVVRIVDRIAKRPGQFRHDLADLDGLFRRAGDERREAFPKFRPDDAQAMIIFDGLTEEGSFGNEARMSGKETSSAR
jgi:hypothetical protein